MEDVGGFSVFYCVSPVQSGVVAYHGAVPLHVLFSGRGRFLHDTGVGGGVKVSICLSVCAFFACTINTKMGACCEDCASLFPRRCCVLTMRAEVEVKLTEAGS